MRSLILVSGAALALAGLCSISTGEDEELASGGGGGVNVDELQHSRETESADGEQVADGDASGGDESDDAGDGDSEDGEGADEGEG